MANARSRDWLFGPGPDLLLGCGGGYLLVFGLLALQGPTIRAWLPLALIPLLVNSLLLPHYGATLIRVYENRSDRRAYAFGAVWMTLLLAGVFIASLHSVLLGSLLVTVYLTWSPWHYSWQNYGIAVLFLRRRDIAISGAAARLLRLSFHAGLWLVWLALHGEASLGNYAPGAIRGDALRILPLGIPAGPRDAAIVVAGIAYLGATAGAVALLLRSAPWRKLIPTLLMLLTQGLWFGIPVLVRHFGWFSSIEPLSIEHATYTFMWIAMGHGTQYLWVSAYFFNARDRQRRYGRFLFRSLAVGAAAWTLPALAFAPGLIGSIPFEAGLGLLVASVVNIHHFIIDGEIWKLRSKPIAKILVQAGSGSNGTQNEHSSLHRYGWGILTAAGVLAYAITMTETVEREVGIERAFSRGDLERVEQAARHLAWLGFDGPEAHTRVGSLAVARNDLARAARAFEHSLELWPTAAAWTGLGYVRGQLRGDWNSALAAFRAALDLDASYGEALFHSGVAYLELGLPERALEQLQAAERASPGLEKVRRALERARAAVAPGAAKSRGPPP